MKSFSASLALHCLLYVAAAVAVGQSVDVPSESVDEINRRGTFVQPLGFAHADEAGDVFGQPESDAHRWFITVVTADNCPDCEQIVKDFSAAPTLRSWVNLTEPKKSWAFYQVRRVEDPKNAAWLKGIRDRLAPYPAIVLQPPTHGKYGPNDKAAAILHGYDDAEKLAAAIGDAVHRYLRTLPQAPNEVFGPPEDDSHKWFITVVTTAGCSACDRLKRDFVSSPTLRTWVNVQEPDKSWAHYQVRRAEDATQRDWLKGIRDRLAPYPAIVIQPPKNGKYGPNENVVAILHGYDGDAEKLTHEMSAAMLYYVSKIRKPATGGHGQVEAPPPFDAPKIDPTQPTDPNPDWPPKKPEQPEHPTPAPTAWGIFLTALAGGFAGSGLGPIIAWALQVWRMWRKAARLPVALTDEQMAQLVALLNPSKPSTPSP